MTSPRRGLYEQLMTEGLQARLREIEDGLGTEEREVRPAEAADRIALHTPELADRFELLPCDERRWRQARQPVREGQGTFRLRLLDAYGQRCAVTAERVVPVLEAAHIQPYLGAASNHVQNGLLLRSDLHHLFDEGYLTVTPDYTMRVSERIREEYENGRDYYALRDRPVKVPDDPVCKPSREALAWHEEFVFS